jgi:5-methylthioadenosine/S-adenosylhomocysteine deaminase
MSTLFRDVLVYDPQAPDRISGPTDVLVAGQHIAQLGVGLEAPADARVVEGAGHHLLVPG